jgi:hypothetical protein
MGGYQRVLKYSKIFTLYTSFCDSMSEKNKPLQSNCDSLVQGGGKESGLAEV